MEMEQMERGDRPSAQCNSAVHANVSGADGLHTGRDVECDKVDLCRRFTRADGASERACQQLAMYVVYESPLQMLSDSPSNYEREPESMEFLRAVPTTVGRKPFRSMEDCRIRGGCSAQWKDWYAGAMTKLGRPRCEDRFVVFTRGKFTMDAYQDGVNADRMASDYKKTTTTVTKNTKLKIHLAPGGGWAARIHPLGIFIKLVNLSTSWPPLKLSRVTRYRGVGGELPRYLASEFSSANFDRVNLSVSKEALHDAFGISPVIFGFSLQCVQLAVCGVTTSVRLVARSLRCFAALES